MKMHNMHCNEELEQYYLEKYYENLNNIINEHDRT